MLRFLKYLILVPVAILVLIFAFANRQMVAVSFDPLASADMPEYTLSAPLFIIIIVSVMVGVVAGGVATWIAQGRHRRAARQARAEVVFLRADLQAARSAAASSQSLSRRA